MVPTSEAPYTYRIRGHNKAGWGEFSAMSAPRRGVVAPCAPTITGVSAGDRQLTVTYTPGSRGGASTGEVAYQHRLNGGGWAAFPGNGVITGLSNGTSYTVEMRAVSTVSGTTYAGGVSNSVREVPYGLPTAPDRESEKPRAEHRAQLGLHRVDNGRPIELTQIKIDGGGWQDVGSQTGSRTVGNGYSETHSIEVRARDSVGNWTPVASDSAAHQRPAPAAGVGHAGRHRPGAASTDAVECVVHLVTT